MRCFLCIIGCHNSVSVCSLAIISFVFIILKFVPFLQRIVDVAEAEGLLICRSRYGMCICLLCRCRLLYPLSLPPCDLRAVPVGKGSSRPAWCPPSIRVTVTASHTEVRLLWVTNYVNERVITHSIFTGPNQARHGDFGKRCKKSFITRCSPNLYNISSWSTSWHVSSAD